MAIPVVPINSRIPELAITTPNTFSLLGFDLQAGVTYQFAAFGRDDAGGTLADPDLVVTDTNGQGNPVHALVYGDNSLLSHDPVVLFTPKVSGQYRRFHWWSRWSRDLRPAREHLWRPSYVRRPRWVNWVTMILSDTQRKWGA